MGNVVAMSHDENPKQRILSEIGNIDDIQVLNNQVLVAVYVRPEKTKGGIFLPGQAREEDRFQSKVGLIVKSGPIAFVDENGKWFRDADINVHDWIVFRPSDGWNITINGVLCRMLEDTSVRAKVSGPDQVW
jgi:co-chaperonin GroES (HSP10)